MVKLKGLGLVTVALATTPEPLSASEIRSPGASIQAPATNTGNVRVGNASVATIFAGELRPGESMEITGPLISGREDEFSLSDIYIDVDVDGEGVIVGYWERSI